MSEYTFHYRRYGGSDTMPLRLYWELSGDPLTDNYTPDEISAEELWDLWIDRYAKPTMDIWWFVAGRGKFEAAPFHENRLIREDFLTYYTWPEDEDGRALQWTRLPVEDKLWTPGRSDKGGFIQSATGWKPSALQRAADVSLIARAAGLREPRP